MTLARALMARLRGWRDPDPVCLGVWWVPDHTDDRTEPATRPPAVSDAPSRPEPTPGTHPPHHEPAQATPDTDHPDLRDLGKNPPAQQLARDRLYATIGNAVNIGVGLGIVTWVVWGISVIVGWFA